MKLNPLIMGAVAVGAVLLYQRSKRNGAATSSDDPVEVTEPEPVEPIPDPPPIVTPRPLPPPTRV